MADESQIMVHDNTITGAIRDLSAEIDTSTGIIEDRLAELILAQPDNRALTQNRALLLQAFSELDNIQTIMPEALSEIANDTISLQGIGGRDAEDTGAQNTLSEIAQNEFATEVENTKNTIVDAVILGAVGGVAINELAQQARYGVSGLYAQTNNADARRLQTRLRSLENADIKDAGAIQAVVSQLRDALGGVARGANLRSLGQRVIAETVMRFDGAFSGGRAKRRNIKKFEYAGGVIETSRPFCEDLAGAVLTEEEIYDIWNSESWGGKEPGDPFVVRGGYNCRHFWVPVPDDE